MENTQTNGEIKELTGLLKTNCIFNAVKGFYLENKKQCKIGHTNVNNIRHKIEPFKEILQENIFNILSIQETKIDEFFPDMQFSVSRYRLYRKDYKHNEGGLMFYVRNDIPQFRRNDLECFSMDDNNGRIEIIALEIMFNKENGY